MLDKLFDRTSVLAVHLFWHIMPYSQSTNKNSQNVLGLTVLTVLGFAHAWNYFCTVLIYGGLSWKVLGNKLSLEKQWESLQYETWILRYLAHTFVEIDHEIISTAILLPSADSRRVVVSYKRKYVHKVLVTRLVKLAQEKKEWLGELTVSTIAVDWDIKHQTNKYLNLLFSVRLKPVN